MLRLFSLCMCALISSALTRKMCTTPVPLNTIEKLKKLKGSNNIMEDARLTVPQLVRKYGYPMEIHRVTTSDGYILNMHRIPHGRDRNNQPDKHKQVVFVMHGLTCSSAEFVTTGPGVGLAYILAEAGFDVWLANARGNRYSRHHISLDPDAILDAKFWQFSWDEIGRIDQPAMIDYILEQTHQKRLHFIGHSQGTTAFFVMCALRPKYNKKIITMHAMGPVAYLTHSFCLLIRALAPLSIGVMGKISDLIGIGELRPDPLLMKWAGQTLCRDEAITQKICSNLVFLIGGWNSNKYNASMLPILLSHYPAGASIRQFVHYAQVMQSRRFQRFSHGLFKNMAEYGSLEPPVYDLSKVRAPVYLYYSPNDPFAHLKDVKRLWRELGNPVEKFLIDITHFDFAWGTQAKSDVYDRIIDIIQGMNGTRSKTKKRKF